MCRVERQVFDVAFVPVDLDSRDTRVLARFRQEIRCEIEARDFRAESRRSDGNDARAAPDVEHAVPAPDARVLTSCAAVAVVIACSGVKNAQPAFWTCLNATNGSGVVVVMSFSLPNYRNQRREFSCSNQAGETLLGSFHGVGGFHGAQPCWNPMVFMLRSRRIAKLAHGFKKDRDLVPTRSA